MPSPAPQPTPAFQSADSLFSVFQGDCNEILPAFAECFDLIFADPPYFLSNDGLSIQSGKIVSVNKGEWEGERASTTSTPLTSDGLQTQGLP